MTRDCGEHVTNSTVLYLKTISFTVVENCRDLEMKCDDEFEFVDSVDSISEIESCEVVS